MQGKNVAIAALAKRKKRDSVLNTEIGTDKNAPPFKPDARHPVHPHYWAPFILIGNWQ
jgi:CHAT domain-containing protein